MGEKRFDARKARMKPKKISEYWFESLGNPHVKYEVGDFVEIQKDGKWIQGSAKDTHDKDSERACNVRSAREMRLLPGEEIKEVVGVSLIGGGTGWKYFGTGEKNLRKRYKVGEKITVGSNNFPGTVRKIERNWVTVHYERDGLISEDKEGYWAQQFPIRSGDLHKITASSLPKNESRRSRR